MNKRFNGLPIFDTKEHIDDQRDLHDYPALRSFLEGLPQPTEALLADFKVSWRFVADYSDSPATFNRFRGEVQRFLNYLWVVGRRTLPQTDSDTVKLYFKTLGNPPSGWISRGIYPAFIDQNGLREPNEKWRPFVIRSTAPDAKYHVAQASLNASKTALATFFRYLIEHDHLQKDPMTGLRRRDRRAKPKDRAGDDETEVRRLTDNQWHLIRAIVEKAADDDPQYERHLFIVLTMKTLFLRVSELAPRQMDGREDRIPVFDDFRRKVVKKDSVWTFRVFGKGDKGRSVTVPDAYLPYLKRWRAHLGLEPPLPVKGDNHPILPSQRGGKAIGKRQVQRAYEQAIDLVVAELESREEKETAAALKALRSETHYLRHTGASQAINAGADIRHISEELGHASAAFTEAVYVNADQDKRRLSGRNRGI
jgi:integrase